ncbi:MAG: UPF0175 family protein [Caldilineaceae bacterium]
MHKAMNDVTVTFPQQLLVAAKEDRQTFERHVMIYTLGHLYDQGKISAGFGAQILGCDRWEFYRLLVEHGFDAIDYAEDELEAEAEVGPEWFAQVDRRERSHQ